MTKALLFWQVQIYIAAILLFLLMKLGGWVEIAPLVSSLAVLALLASIPLASWGARILTLLFVTSGYVMLWKAEALLPTFLLNHGSMLYLLALFAVLPVLSVPVELGNYGHSIEKILRAKVQHIFHLNILVTGFAFICGSFMSLAAIPIMMTSMAPAVQHYPLKNSVQFRSVAATYGYVLPILWTPVSGVVGVVLGALEVEWLQALPILASLSIAALLINWVVFYFLEVRSTPIRNRTIERNADFNLDVRPSLFHLAQIVVAVALMILSVAWFEWRFRIGMLTVVTLIAIPFAGLWCLCLHKGPEFLVSAKSQLSHQLMRMPDQFAVFLAAGFFVSCLNVSGLDHQLNLQFLHLHELLGTKIFLLTIPLLALAAAIIGVHPVVAIALLGESLKPAVLGINAMELTFTLIGSAVLTYMLGPFGGTLGLMQSITRISSFRLALWNLPYALAYWLLLMLFIVLY